MLRIRAIGLALALAAAAPPLLLLPGDARASVSIAVTYDSLLGESTSAVIVVPREQRSVWENGRIYTYTRVGIDRALAGGLAPGQEVWVRTMGGIVGKVGQSVDGEAVLTVGRPALLFLHPGPPGAHEVTARAQGQFPVVVDSAAQTVKLVKSSGVGALVMPRMPARTGMTTLSSATAQRPLLAAERIHGQLLDDVSRDVSASWARTHGQ